jgi:hypothetical protein
MAAANVKSQYATRPNVCHMHVANLNSETVSTPVEIVTICTTGAIRQSRDKQKKYFTPCAK